MRALLSVSDKTGLIDFARALHARGIELIATGGTARALRDAGLPLLDIAEVTGFPEMLDGRVKTLHPAIHGGLLARRDLPAHMETLAQHNIAPIDFVVVNLYPFAAAAANASLAEHEIIEQIDIGGPSMLRSAAKNFASVTVVCDPKDYPQISAEIGEHGTTKPQTRRRLAAKVFAHTAAYDAMIAEFFSRSDSAETFPEDFTLKGTRVQSLRYGENPHQGAAFYRTRGAEETSLTSARQLQGKELSYNNILDGDGALEAVREFADLAHAACVIVKHGNPCGIALGATAHEAFSRARETDPDSAFGGIVALSVPLDEATARACGEMFLEVIITPNCTPEARDVLASKKNLRILETGAFTPRLPTQLVRAVTGGFLVMDRDLGCVTAGELKVVTRRAPSAEDLAGLLFAWRCAKWVKSNAIVYASANATLGIGAGQMSRVDSARIGAMKARASLDGCFLASDAFFPFRDGIDSAAKHGVRAVIQPGGSVRDSEVIAAADEHDIAMVFTGMRHFRH